MCSHDPGMCFLRGTLAMPNGLGFSRSEESNESSGLWQLHKGPV